MKTKTVEVFIAIFVLAIVMIPFCLKPIITAMVNVEIYRTLSHDKKLAPVYDMLTAVDRVNLILRKELFRENYFHDISKDKVVNYSYLKMKDVSEMISSEFGIMIEDGEWMKWETVSDIYNSTKLKIMLKYSSTVSE